MTRGGARGTGEYRGSYRGRGGFRGGRGYYQGGERTEGHGNAFFRNNRYENRGGYRQDYRRHNEEEFHDSAKEDMSSGGFQMVTARGQKDSNPVPFNESKGPRIARGA